MSLSESLQSLEPGSYITLYELDASLLGGGVLRLHEHLQPDPIFWQGAEFVPWPVIADGFSFTTDKPPQPRIIVGNTNRIATLLCLQFDDLVGAKVTRKRTFLRFLDAENFQNGNPTADPSQYLPDDIWFIERKASETREGVEFELSSGIDFNGNRLPKRQIINNTCVWAYRSVECGYSGRPVATDVDESTSDPALDRCGKRLRSCKLRFGENAVLNYGGFPAASLVRY